MNLGETVGSLLVLYGWVVAAILVFFLYLIGRLYEVKFKQRSHYQLLLLPLAFFLVAALWYVLAPAQAFLNDSRDFVGLVVPDLLFLLAGLVLAVLCYSLYRVMIGRKAGPHDR
jgi:membrane-associated HD superfamily phosphohydrolase